MSQSIWHGSQEAGKGERHSFSSWSITQTFTAIRNSEHCMFYKSDDISRVMPGKKHFVSVKKDSKPQHIQKRLVLGNLKEVYREFKERFPHCKIGFSKFAELRPKHHCVLAGASGTHICVYNTSKGQVVAMQIPELPTYHHCLAKIMCNPPHLRCYLGA